MTVHVGLTTLQLALVVACGYALYAIATTLASASSPDPIDLAAQVPAPVPVEAGALSDYRVIAERNLFQSSRVGALLPEPTEEERLRETRLPLRLRGTIVSSVPEDSIATIEHKTARETLTLHEGESLQQVRVDRILRGSVVITHAGGTERLTFRPDEDASGQRAKTRGAARARRVRTARAERSSPAATTARSVPRPRRSTRSTRRAPDPDPADEVEEAPPAAMDELDEEAGERMQELSAQARFLPDFGESGLRGIRVADLKAGTQLERLGLRNDDVIVSVAGRPIEGSNDVFRTLRGIDVSSGVSVEVERGGTNMVLEVPAGAL